MSKNAPVPYHPPKTKKHPGGRAENKIINNFQLRTEFPHCKKQHQKHRPDHCHLPLMKLFPFKIFLLGRRWHQLLLLHYDSPSYSSILSFHILLYAGKPRFVTSVQSLLPLLSHSLSPQPANPDSCLYPLRGFVFCESFC